MKDNPSFFPYKDATFYLISFIKCFCNRESVGHIPWKFHKKIQVIKRAFRRLKKSAKWSSRPTTLTPVFHSPESNKHLLWLNRKGDNTEYLRPDATMKYFDRKLSGTTLGYCEVKPPDARNDIDSLCTDLIRLAIFSRNIMLRKANHLACSLQAVGQNCSFYVLSKLTPNITIMNEIISFDIPLEIKELANLNNIVDDLKKISKTYGNHCQKRYVSEVEDQDTNVATIVKPKRRKRVTDVSPITFK